MADGPRCQRRKQTWPQRSKVRNFTSVPDATSESDDEDKLLIVEDDSIPDDPEQKPSVFPLKAVPHVSVTCTEDADGSLGQNGLLQEIRVKEECVSEEDIPEEAGRKKRLDSKRIYSDASKAHQKKQEKGVHDENGTPDDFPQLHTCPHCARGYKRHTSLKEHIKLRHEKNEDNYCCSLCSYSFTYRTQLVRHMTAHRNIQQRNNSQAGGARKFKCTVCSKAFKYKHHLKEHLRIHSGEKPYECSNCQKRFSHSGSYSSHISNMKCATVAPEANSLSHAKERKVSRTRLTQAPLKEKLEISSKPLQEQLPAKQIKQEPVEHQPKLVTANGVVAPVQGSAGQGVVQTLVLPTVGLVHPISINLSDLQNALSAAMEGNVIRQVLTSANTNGGGNKIVGSVPTQAQTVVLQPQQTQPQMISAISLPVVGQDGNAKLIINYNPQPVQTVKANVAQTTMATATESVSQPILVQSQAKPSVTEVQTSAKPHVKIIKPVQATNSIKIPSIIKISPEQANRLVQARVAQSKPIQQTFLLVRRADGSQSIVVRQQSIASSKTEGSPAIDSELKSSPEKPANPPTVEKETAEKVSCLEEVCDQPKQDSNVPLDVKIKTEPPSPSVTPNGEKNLMETTRSEESIDALTHSGTVHSSVAYGDNFHNYASCLLCDRNTDKQKFLDNQDSDSSDTPTTISLTSLLDKDKSGAAERLLPLLKAYSQNPEPTEEQMSQVAKEVKLPLESIRKWYLKMRSKRILLQSTSSKKKNKETKSSTGESANKRTPPVEDPLDAIENKRLPSPLQLSTPGDFVIVKTEDVEEEMQSEPLDLSLPKSSPAEPKQPVSSQKEPLNLTCLKKQPLQGNTVFLTQPSMGPLNIMTGTLPTLVAITEPSGVTRCVRAALSPNKRTIFIPQLTYTYSTDSSATSLDKAPADTKGTVILNNSVVTDSDGVSGVEDQNDEDLQVTKKQRRSLSGLYSCDLCDKIFQKSSSLLRHKYEHTGKRPHECGVCNKAFKHKHHLIEHTRLHSGEKPYQCDKCGKRFSHSGSYSQHMNHRYSYCKRDPHDSLEQNTTTPHPAPLDSDERESDGEEEEEEDDLSAYDMSDIRVIRVGEEDEEENAEYEEQVMEEETRPRVMEEEEMLMEVEIEDFHHQEKETVDASFVSHSQTDGCLWD